MRTVLRVGLATIALGLWTAVPAQAVTFNVDSVGDTLNLDLTGFSDPNNIPVSASLDFVTTAFGPTSVTFQITAENTSNPAVLSRLTGFGFDIDPTASSGTTSSTIFNGILVDENPNANSFNVCVGGTSSPPTLQNCNGFQGGLDQDDPSHTFLLTLNFDDPITGLTLVLDNFFARLQGIGPQGDSAKIDTPTTTTTTDTTTTNGSTVPEPATLLLLGAGLALAGRRFRRSVA